MKTSRSSRAKRPHPVPTSPSLVAAKALVAKGKMNPTWGELRRELRKAKKAATANFDDERQTIFTMGMANEAFLSHLRTVAPTMALSASQGNADLFVNLVESMSDEGGETLNLALPRLVNFLREAILLLNRLSVRDPKAVAEVASVSESWPVLVSRLEESFLDARKLVNALNVGRASGLKVGPINAKQKGISYHVPATREALRLKGVVESVMVTLLATDTEAGAPEWFSDALQIPNLFGYDGWEGWFSIGWRQLLLETNGHPESREDLRKLGMHRAGVSGRDKQHKRSDEADNIREGIQGRLRTAFKNISAFPTDAGSKNRESE